MSRPRGTRVQRKLVEAAREMLEPHGARLEVDFSQRGGHQQLIVMFAGSAPLRITLVSTPTSEEESIDRLRQKCRRLLRGMRR